MKIKSLPALPPKTVIMVTLIIVAVFLVWLVWPRNWQPSSDAPDSSPLLPALSGSMPILPIPDAIPNLDQNKVALGKALFHEVRLSHDNTIACSSCHPLERGGVDGKKFATGIGGQLSGVNAPTVYNSAFNFRQFWNGRAETLEEQAAGPIHNPLEMGSSWAEVIAKLKQHPVYPAAFSKIYRDGITAGNIANAIATFVRSLITPNSRFDKYLKGDATAITPFELSGYERFASYGCISCHQGVNIGGNLYEKLGIMRDYFAERGNITEADKGRYSLTNDPDDLYMFKVPGLRNVALTAPYLHDGTAQSLEQVIIIMGKYQLGVSMPAEDVAKIAAFLRTLTGEYNGKPL